MSNRWFRWYEGTCEDGKFRAVALMSRVTVRDVLALWAFILEDASNYDHRGVCERNEDFMMAVLNLENDTLVNILGAMETVGIISVGHGAITVSHWDERQFESDFDRTASRRKREQRERDKSTSHTPITDTSRVTQAAQTTDTDTDKKVSRSVAKATRPASDPVFEQFKTNYPKRSGSNPWAPARKLFATALTAGADAEKIIEAVRAYADELKRTGKLGSEHVAQAQTWLRQQRWQDYAEAPKPNGNGADHGGYHAAAQSEQLEAWDAYRKTKLGDGKGFPRDASGGWTFPSEWPPGYAPLLSPTANLMEGLE